jgi:hypothetical protein
MPRGYNQPLYILPFDHRGSFELKMFGWTGKARRTARLFLRQDRVSLAEPLISASTALEGCHYMGPIHYLGAPKGHEN